MKNKSTYIAAAAAAVLVPVALFLHTLSASPLPKPKLYMGPVPSATPPKEMAGDLVWQLEGITLREERPWITRKLADSDAEGNRENLLRMIALKERMPDLIIVPAHDMRAFAGMPTLSQAKERESVCEYE